MRTANVSIKEKVFGGGGLQENPEYQKSLNKKTRGQSVLLTQDSRPSVLIKVITDHYHFQHLVEPKLRGNWLKPNHANQTNKS